MKVLLTLVLLSLAINTEGMLTHRQLVAKYNELKKQYHQENILRTMADEKEHFLEFSRTSDMIENHNADRSQCLNNLHRTIGTEELGKTRNTKCRVTQIGKLREEDSTSKRPRQMWKLLGIRCKCSFGIPDKP
ncbi:hypothetical protein ACHWQZ_G016697 [Mnemiopsis leidyi]